MRSRKTDTETRAAVHPFLARILHQETKKTVGHVMPKLAKLYLSGRSGRIKISTMISDLFESIGINTKYVEDGKRARSDCGFHSLRHTFVTMLRAGGATLQTAKAMAGHHTERMTEHYTHEDGSATLALPDFFYYVTPKTPKPQNASWWFYNRILEKACEQMMWFLEGQRIGEGLADARHAGDYEPPVTVDDIYADAISQVVKSPGGEAAASALGFMLKAFHAYTGSASPDDVKESQRERAARWSIESFT